MPNQTMPRPVNAPLACLFAIAVLAFSLTGCGSEKAVVPTSYTSYNAKDGTFACDAPEQWEITGGGKQGPVWAKFTSGPAVISIKADVTGSLIGDIQGTLGGGNQAVLPEDEPVHVVHVSAMEDAAKEYDGYAETAAGPAVITSRLGPARLSEFTAETSFGTPLHGYRATILGHDKRVTVFCVAPEADWTALKPAFDQVIASLERGSAE
jgi:hypothetical protein